MRSLPTAMMVDQLDPIPPLLGARLPRADEIKKERAEVDKIAAVQNFEIYNHYGVGHAMYGREPKKAAFAGQEKSRLNRDPAPVQISKYEFVQKDYIATAQDLLAGYSMSGCHEVLRNKIEDAYPVAEYSWDQRMRLSGKIINDTIGMGRRLKDASFGQCVEILAGLLRVIDSRAPAKSAVPTKKDSEHYFETARDILANYPTDTERIAVVRDKMNEAWPGPGFMSEKADFLIAKVMGPSRKLNNASFSECIEMLAELLRQIDKKSENAVSAIKLTRGATYSRRTEDVVRQIQDAAALQGYRVTVAAHIDGLYSVSID